MIAEMDYLKIRRNISCLCGKSQSLRFKKSDRYEIKFDFVLCGHCGHVYISNPLSDDATNQFYSSSDYRDLYFGGVPRETVFERKVCNPATGQALLNFIQNKLNITNGKIIEWGSGGGWNLIPFQTAGWQVEGYDLDEFYVNLGRNQLGMNLNVIKKDAFNHQLQDKPDVILINHVIEHVINPKQLLKEIKSWCSKDTKIIIGIPLLENISQWGWEKFFHIAHVHYFSCNSFKDLVAESGYEIKYIDINKGLFILSPGNFEQMKARRFKLKVLTSSFLLMGGCIELSYRIRAGMRFILNFFGLLEKARELRARLISLAVFKK